MPTRILFRATGTKVLHRHQLYGKKIAAAGVGREAGQHTSEKLYLYGSDRINDIDEECVLLHPYKEFWTRARIGTIFGGGAGVYEYLYAGCII